MNLEDQLKNALKVEVPEDVKLSVRERVMADARRSQAQKGLSADSQARPFWPFSWKMMRLHPVTLSLLIFLPVFAGTAAASSTAAPDGFLYPVRQKIEEARVSLHRDSAGQARAELERANQRLNEITEMLHEGKSGYMNDLLSRYTASMNRAITLKNEAAGSGQDISDLDALASATSSRYEEILALILSTSLSGDIGPGAESGHLSGLAEAGQPADGNDSGRATDGASPSAAPASGQSAGAGANAASPGNYDVPGSEAANGPAGATAAPGADQNNDTAQSNAGDKKDGVTLAGAGKPEVTQSHGASGWNKAASAGSKSGKSRAPVTAKTAKAGR